MCPLVQAQLKKFNYRKALSCLAYELNQQRTPWDPVGSLLDHLGPALHPLGPLDALGRWRPTHRLPLPISWFGLSLRLWKVLILLFRSVADQSFTNDFTRHETFLHHCITCLHHSSFSQSIFHREFMLGYSMPWESLQSSRWLFL